MDATEFRRASLTTWDGLATGWDSWHSTIDRVFAPVNDWLLRGLAARRGETILELAAGPGEVGFVAAAQLGPDGRLLSTDFSPRMVEVARRRGTERGLTNVDYRVMDAEKIDLEDGSVDAVLCCFGYMLMADAAAALRETRRVLRPGGRAVFSVWAPIERNPWAGVTARVLKERGHIPPPPPGAADPFGMGDPDRTRALLESVGFSRVHTEEVPVCFGAEDVDQFLSLMRDSAPFGRALCSISAGETDAINAELGRAFAPFAGEAGYALPGVALATVAS